MQKVRGILKLLEAEYNIKEWVPEKTDPLDILIATILSQNTSDINSSRAFSSLKKHYKSWYGVLEEKEGRIAKIIRKGGLPRVKAKRIKLTLLKIFEERGELDIGFLKNMSLKKSMEWLQKLPGVGPKTAAVVLNFGFGKNIIPVDTHVYRVSRRIGLINEKTPAKAQKELNKKIPPELSYLFHMLLITHGRKICRARNPLCKKCVINKFCDYFKSQ